jgi:hypothetical protein
MKPTPAAAAIANPESSRAAQRPTDQFILELALECLQREIREERFDASRLEGVFMSRTVERGVAVLLQMIRSPQWKLRWNKVLIGEEMLNGLVAVPTGEGGSPSPDEGRPEV